jgi:hypothetical protein
MNGGRDETAGIQNKGMIVWMCVGCRNVKHWNEIN